MAEKIKKCKNCVYHRVVMVDADMYASSCTKLGCYVFPEATNCEKYKEHESR